MPPVPEMTPELLSSRFYGLDSEDWSAVPVIVTQSDGA